MSRFPALKSRSEFEPDHLITDVIRTRGWWGCPVRSDLLTATFIFMKLVLGWIRLTPDSLAALINPSCWPALSPVAPLLFVACCPRIFWWGRGKHSSACREEAGFHLGSGLRQLTAYPEHLEMIYVMRSAVGCRSEAMVAGLRCHHKVALWFIELRSIVV